MKKLGLILSMIVLCFIISEAKEKHFKRIETFPSGHQTKILIGSFFSGIKDYKIVKYNFDAPYEIVWPVIKQVSQTFAKVGGRSVIAIDENTGRVQNGLITQNATIGMGSGAWMDEFVMEAKKLGTKTNVIVMRKIVKRGYTGSRAWKTHCSNGKIEKYLLTQIEDGIKNYSASQPPPIDSQGTAAAVPNDLAKSATGKYVNKYKPTDYCELKADGTFYSVDTGIVATGKYNISGETITLILSNGRSYQFPFRENLIIGSGGRPYTKTEESQSASSTPSEIIGNADVLLMVEAKFSEAVIISKIKNSKCKFDTSINELIKLKKAGVSDAIVQVMTEISSK